VIDGLRTFAGPLAQTDKVLLLGQSQGSLNALAWAMRNPELVAGVACILPIPSLAAMHDSPGAPSYAASIEAAYGGLAGYTAAVGDHDPDQNRELLAGVPIKFWYSNNDPTSPPAPALAFAAATGVEAVDMGALGHLPGAQYAPDVAAWLASVNEM
jgi:pimeloyl-ACP methyl ester carboxylesterase